MHFNKKIYKSIVKCRKKNKKNFKFHPLCCVFCIFRLVLGRRLSSFCEQRTRRAGASDCRGDDGGRRRSSAEFRRS